MIERLWLRVYAWKLSWMIAALVRRIFRQSFRVEVGYSYEGPYRDPAWQTELDRMWDPRNPASWLKIVWESGIPEVPMGRWLVYQMYPKNYFDPDRLKFRPQGLAASRLAELRGPAPRLLNYWDDVLDAYVVECMFVNQTQWDIYQETSHFGRPLWIVQGPLGGHKVEYDKLDKALCQMNERPREPPDPGDLPYAKPDWRVWAKLWELDRIQFSKASLRMLEQNPAALTRREARETEMELRQHVWNWLDDQAYNWAELAEPVAKDQTLDLPRPHPGMRQALEEYEEAYLTLKA